jgi:hypothetical protein
MTDTNNDHDELSELKMKSSGFEQVLLGRRECVAATMWMPRWKLSDPEPVALTGVRCFVHTALYSTIWGSPGTVQAELDISSERRSHFKGTWRWLSAEHHVSCWMRLGVGH